MKKISKTLLKKGVMAISVSAFVGMVYASQMHFTMALVKPLLSKQAVMPIDSPPPDSIAPTDTKTGGVQDTTGDYEAKKKSAKIVDTTKLHYPISKSGQGRMGSFDLKSPVEKSVEVDSTLNNYKISDKIGNTTVGEPQTVPFKDYEESQNKQYIEDYFKRRSESQVASQKGGLLPKLNLNTGNEEIDKLINEVKISPQGSAELIFSEDFSRVQNPTYSLQQQQSNQFKFDQKIQVSVTASIGDKIKMSFKYDTQASFDFENQRKLSYEGKDDEIIKSIQIGDVSMPLSSSLISGSQSLFGVKAKLQFGKLDVTSVFAQEKSDKKEITLQGGAQVTPFNITCDNYDAFRHYFLSQYFRDHFDQFNANWPSLSNIQITRVEVWVTNVGATTINTRSLAAFQDLGENQPYNATTSSNPFVSRNPSAVLPSNSSNNLFSKLSAPGSPYRSASNIANALSVLPTSSHFLPTEDYYILNNARQLQPTEFTFNPHLGYISLNQQLNPNDVLAVAFQYTVDGKTYQVGEFASDVPPNSTNPNVLFLKMLKSVSVDTRLPDWKLMMKNIYSLGAYQVSPTNFKFQVVYDDAQTGSYLNYLPEPTIPSLNGIPIIRLLGMDRINSEQEPTPDGQFDYIEGVTINSQTGKIIFPVVEPFGQDLSKLFTDPVLASKYAYQLLYDSSHTAAIQDAVHNKFTLVGSYQGTSGSVISLNSINVPQGSVKVYADGVPLVEGTDYTVDYNLGKVTIIKSSILNSGSVIKVTSESNSLFSIQQKTMLGTHLDYHISKDFTVGGTLLHLGERPLTTIVNVGSEPIDNTIFGFDGHYHTESQFLTDMVNKIPLIQTKAKSDITAEGEYAQILYLAILRQSMTQADPGGVSYIDDFEGSVVPYDLRLGNNWTLSSCPQGQTTRFPEANSLQLDYGYRRAKLAWYMIDNVFYSAIPGSTPANILGNNNLLSDPYQRSVQEIEVFPNEQIPSGSPGILQTFDMVYRPAARGPYNFNSSRLNSSGRFNDPQNSWAGIQRSLPTTDFEAANIQYVEMWVMDPYQAGTGNPATPIGTGEMDIDLGTVSEDILHDNRESYENGLSCDTTGTDPTVWGRVPNGIHITTSFSTDPTLRPCQDVGYDGLNDADERTHFATPLKAIQNIVNPNIFNNINNDPSGDNFIWFRDGSYDASNANIIQRYMEINGVQNNTPIATSNTVGIGSPNPDDEDINHDFNIETSEAYYEYVVKLNKADLATVGRNYVADIQTSTVTLANGKQQSVNWIQLKVPITDYQRVIGPIQDFKSIRFMRIYFTGFVDSINLRFGRLQLVRDDWRKYNYPLAAAGDPLPTDTAEASLDVSAVSLNADGKRPQPSISYVIPPGIQRQIDYSTPSLTQLNEQSLDLKICGLKAGDAKAVFKNTTLDIRQYKTLKMFVHAEAQNQTPPVLKDNDLHIFIRVGADFTQNYYEYDMPLTVTLPSQSGDVGETWPMNNQMRLAMQEWVNLKLARTKQGGSLIIPYTANAVSSPGTITVLGNPDIGTIKEIMIGLRHPKNDGKPPTPCAEVWVDELRVSDFDETGGWAATGRVVAKLADFGRVEVTATRQTIGFGGLDQSLLQRNQSDMQSFGVTSSFELGKFFPSKYGTIHVPLYVSYSQQVNTPRYDPLSPDLPLSALTGLYNNNLAKQDSVMQAAQDFTARKNLNFTGVHKDRNPKRTSKPKIYDIENFTATYVYSEIDRHNITSIYDNQKIYSGTLQYSYTVDKPKVLEPFKKLKSKYLHLISDFNLYYLPQSFSFIAKIDRTFSETLYRNTDSYLTINLPLYNKTFFFTRTYNFKYNLTRSLRFNYSAVGTSRIDEPDGLIDSSYKQQEILHNILKGGNLTDFTQTTGVTYDVPINKLPFLDFVTVNTGYTANYEWKAAPPIALTLGNVVQNAQTITANGNFNLLSLYNKVPYLRNIITGAGNTKTEPEKTDSTSKANAKNKLLKNARNKKQLVPPPKETNPGHLTTGETLVGLLMTVRTVSFSYSQNNGTSLPGFMPTPQHIGENFDLSAPGLPFIFGSQADIRNVAAQNGWITKDTGLSQQFIMSHRETITGAIALEPIKSLQIHVDLNRTQSTTFSETYRYLDTAGGTPGFAHLSPTVSGNYSISVLALATAFVSDGPNNTNATFNKFESYRQQVAYTLAGADPRWNGQSKRDSAGTLFPKGYTGTNQDVLVPAFFAAYTGTGPVNTIFPAIPMPNWKLTYTGLSSIKSFKSFAKQITISSGYHATYSIDNYATNLNYNQSQATPDTGNFASKYNISRITLAERFDPLIGIDVALVSNWTASFSYSKERQESLSFVNQNVTENATNKVVFGLGYITNKFYLPFTGRTKRYLKNEVKFRLDVSINDNKQSVRILDQESGIATGGQVTIAILPNITYTISKALTVNIFFKQNSTVPYTSNQYPTSLTSIGFSLKYILTP